MDWHLGWWDPIWLTVSILDFKLHRLQVADFKETLYMCFNGLAFGICLHGYWSGIINRHPARHMEAAAALVWSLTSENRVKRLQRFDLPPADLDHAMIRVGDSAQVVVVAEWSDHRWLAAGSPGICSCKENIIFLLSAWCGWPPSPCVSTSPVLCLGLSNYPWRHCDRWHYSWLLPWSVYQACTVPWIERWRVSSSPLCRCGGCRRHTWCGRWCRTISPWGFCPWYVRALGGWCYWAYGTGQIIPRPPPPEPSHPPWSLRDQDLLEADRNVAIVSPSVPKWVKFNHFLYESWNHE